jgi:hypothetical protein
LKTLDLGFFIRIKNKKFVGIFLSNKDIYAGWLNAAKQSGTSKQGAPQARTVYRKICFGTKGL